MKAFFLGLGLAVLGAVMPTERAEATTLGSGIVGAAGLLAGTYDQGTGDVTGTGTLRFAYDFDLPLEEAMYTGFYGAVYEADVFDVNGDLVAEQDFVDGDTFGPVPFAVGTGAATDVAAALAFLTGLPAAGALDLSIIGLDSVIGSYSLAPIITPTFGTTATRIFGSGEFVLDFDFTDAAGGDLASEVSLLAPASGSLDFALFAVVEFEAAPVPLPAGAAMLPVGLIGFAVLRRRKAKLAA